MYSLIKVSLRQKAGRGHGKGQGPYDPAPFHNDINISFIENNVGTPNSRMKSCGEGVGFDRYREP